MKMEKRSGQKQIIKKWIVQWIVVMLTIGLWAGGTLAQDTEDTGVNELDLGGTVVWGTQVSSSSISVGEDELSMKQADHLSDLLSDIPGVDVGGTHSINNRINIRGFQDEDLEITLDGAKVQNANMFHHIGNLLINPDILKKAQIQVGTNSVVNGSLSGSVSFETKNSVDLLREGQEFGARISSNYYSNDEYGGSFSGYGKLGEKADFLVYYRHVEKDNWTDGAGVETFGVDGTIYNALVKLGTDFFDNQRISISYDTLHDEGDYSPRPDFGRAYNEARTGFYTYPTEYDRQTVTLKHSIDLGNTLYMTTSVYHNQNELERYEKLDGVTAIRPGYTEGLLSGVVQTQGVNIKARTIFEMASTVNTFTYGVIYDDQTSTVDFAGEKYGDDEEAVSMALFLEDEIYFDFGLKLTPGIRYNYYDYNGAYGNINDNEITWGLGGEYELFQGFSLLASTTTLYKGMEMVDVLASTRVYVADNEGLKSETGVNNQAGFKYSRQNVLGTDTLNFMFTYFDTTIDDHIVQEWDNVSNGGVLKIKGFEASLVCEVGKLRGSMTYSHSDSEFKDSGDPLIKEPGDMFTLGLTYHINPNMRLQWNSIFVAEEDDRPVNISGSNTYTTKEGYNVHDVAFYYKPEWLSNTTVIVGIDNIFDESYVSHISESRAIAATPGGDLYSTNDYEPGRCFKLTLAYTF